MGKNEDLGTADEKKDMVQGITPTTNPYTSNSLFIEGPDGLFINVDQIVSIGRISIEKENKEFLVITSSNGPPITIKDELVDYFLNLVAGYRPVLVRTGVLKLDESPIPSEDKIEIAKK
ncbi:hypothetical protein LCGC14_1094120 [marine sediment metagenome]|uniref:Uncharacterized protein n=1 Tax=marine sediment metagenome TaxID=412755 RepID=A0A0F9PUI3_9ZZZZ